MHELSVNEVEEVNDGISPALGKGILIDIIAGAALFDVAIGAASY